jgi:hypothetical protein
MRRCEDLKMLRENVSQTPAIRRTLRWDALGNKTTFYTAPRCPNSLGEIGKGILYLYYYMS